MCKLNLHISETVCGAYERLKLNQQESGTTDNLTWLRESNEKLRRDVLKVSVFWCARPDADHRP